jgi:hypothetical protein
MRKSTEVVQETNDAVELPYDTYDMEFEKVNSIYIMLNIYIYNDDNFNSSFHLALSRHFPVQWFWNAIELDKCSFSVAECTADREIHCNWHLLPQILTEDDEKVHFRQDGLADCYGEIWQDNILLSMEDTYHDVLSLIRESVYEFMLCLKSRGVIRDIVKLMAKMLWRTRHERVWVKLAYLDSHKLLNNF